MLLQVEENGVRMVGLVPQFVVCRLEKGPNGSGLVAASQDPMIEGRYKSFHGCESQILKFM